MEILRISLAFALAVFGLGLSAWLVYTLKYKFTASSDIVAIVGLFTSVLGTLVGAFFGLQIGAAGTATVQKAADQAGQMAAQQVQSAQQQVQSAQQQLENARLEVQRTQENAQAFREHVLSSMQPESARAVLESFRPRE